MLGLETRCEREGWSRRARGWESQRRKGFRGSIGVITLIGLRSRPRGRNSDPKRKSFFSSRRQSSKQKLKSRHENSRRRSSDWSRRSDGWHTEVREFFARLAEQIWRGGPIAAGATSQTSKSLNPKRSS